ncbi:MAG: DAK2 domain-containing protein [Clostridia bacterium]|nr:DAK2 domain-containing protein [Clostridia bacterium]
MSTKISGIDFYKMVCFGADRLKRNVREINDLNVFPIPDGDTGDNMLMTIMSCVENSVEKTESLSVCSRNIADAILLGARGNSGVILSQFFDGLAEGFEGEESADEKQIKKALSVAVESSYKAVASPVEGTMLTVMREATESICSCDYSEPGKMFEAFTTQAKQTLSRTPQMLSTLKDAGVVDSGGAGFVCIVEGMTAYLCQNEIPSDVEFAFEKDNRDNFDISLFDEDSELEYGYCTELLLRLQKKKCNVLSFDTKDIIVHLNQIGDSVATVKKDSLVKIHVHTKTPDKVLSLCQKYGEFLKIKIENMSLQHGNKTLLERKGTLQKEFSKEFGVVAVCSGNGISNLFTDAGADIVIDGGQSMNPSTGEFIDAFKQLDAKVVFVFPNNKNIIFAAKQAASMYDECQVYVVESENIGEGYAALSMMDTGLGDVDSILSQMNMAMKTAVTLEIARSTKDVNLKGFEITAGNYISVSGKEILSCSQNRFKALCNGISVAGIADKDICIVIYGLKSDKEELQRIEEFINSEYVGKELYFIDGMQEVYDYIVIME